MPSSRVVFQDPDSGRFIRGERAIELENARRLTISEEGTRVELLRFGEIVEDFEEQREENWSTNERTWAFVWEGEDGNFDLGALSVATPPEGVVNYRVVAEVANNPDYPDGYITSDWLGMDRFPPDLTIFRGRNPIGIARIFFEKPR